MVGLWRIGKLEPCKCLNDQLNTPVVLGSCCQSRRFLLTDEEIVHHKARTADKEANLLILVISRLRCWVSNGQYDAKNIQDAVWQKDRSVFATCKRQPLLNPAETFVI